MDWSSSVAARPSQNWAFVNTRLIEAGALRPPCDRRIPVETGCPSVKARDGMWQLPQAIVLFLDMRLSKNSRRPSSTFLAVSGFSLGTNVLASSNPNSSGSVKGSPFAVGALLACFGAATPVSGTARPAATRSTIPAFHMSGDVMVRLLSLRWMPITAALYSVRLHWSNLLCMDDRFTILIDDTYRASLYRGCGARAAFWPGRRALLDHTAGAEPRYSKARRQSGDHYFREAQESDRTDAAWRKNRETGTTGA